MTVPPQVDPDRGRGRDQGGGRADSDTDSFDAQDDDAGPEMLPHPDPGRGSHVRRGRGRGNAYQMPANAPRPDDANQPNPAQIALVGRNGTEWQRNAPNIGRRRVRDVIRQPPGITNEARCNSMGEAFGFFLTSAMIDMVVIETNREARRCYREWNDAKHEQVKVWTAVDDSEMKAFFGILWAVSVCRGPPLQP
jgi:hypothetical protein